MLIIFDCDGVLVDSEGIASEVMAQFVSKLGWPMTASDARHHFKGLSLKRCCELIEPRIGSSIPDDFLSTLQAATLKDFQTKLRAIEGVKDLLEWVDSGQALRCIASSGDHNKMAVSLGVTGIDQYFSNASIFSASQVAKGKPEPDLFLFAASQMGVDASDSIVIEDSLPGVLAALSAGMSVIPFDQDGDLALELKKNGLDSLEIAATMAEVKARLITWSNERGSA